MASAFRFEIPGGGGTMRGVNPEIFRPPASPSLSNSLYLGQSAASLQSDTATPGGGTAKRKRLNTRESTPLNEWAMAMNSAGSGTNAINDDSDYFGRRTNERGRPYVLAGRLETPNGGAQRALAHIEDSVYSDVDYRRGLGPKRPHENTELQSSRTAPANPALRGTMGWSSFAFNTIGGVVGKVWQFCTNSAFRGFYAGGGRGYEMAGGTAQLQARDEQMRDAIQYTGSAPQDDIDPPGRFPQPDYYEGETPDSTPPPAAKRRQISESAPNDELKKNWVIVGGPADTSRQSTTLVASSPQRTVQQPITPSINRRINKPISRLSTPSFNRHHPNRLGDSGARYSADREPASRASFASLASPKSPVMAAYLPSRIPVPVAAQSRPQSPAPASTPRLQQQPSRVASPSPHVRGHRRSQSAISASSMAQGKVTQGKRMKRRESLQELQGNSPRLDAEARNLAAKRAKEAKETDIRINDFNARLRDMIRQGQEALGTTIEVDMDDDFDVDPWEDE